MKNFSIGVSAGILGMLFAGYSEAQSPECRAEVDRICFEQGGCPGTIVRDLISRCTLQGPRRREMRTPRDVDPNGAQALSSEQKMRHADILANPLRPRKLVEILEVFEDPTQLDELFWSGLAFEFAPKGRSTEFGRIVLSWGSNDSFIPGTPGQINVKCRVNPSDMRLLGSDQSIKVIGRIDPYLPGTFPEYSLSCRPQAN